MTADFPQDPDSTANLPLSQALLLPRIAIESTSPVLENGEFAVKATAGQQVDVLSKVFVDGHEQLAVMLHWRLASSAHWSATPMHFLGNDSWNAQFPVPEVGPSMTMLLFWISTSSSLFFFPKA